MTALSTHTCYSSGRQLDDVTSLVCFRSKYKERTETRRLVCLVECL
jgi:hypothetical protein